MFYLYEKIESICFLYGLDFFFLGEVGLKEKFLILNMIDKKYFYYGIRKEWENKIVELFFVNLSKMNKILEYFWLWYFLFMEKKL